jgi:murein DD-endopeptidase MepM/ murein hydrolase activator NlpD
MMAAEIKLSYGKLFFGLTLFFYASLSSAQNQNTLIDVNVKVSTPSEAIITIFNADNFPHLVLVQIFNLSAEESLIAETKTTVSGKEGLSLAVKSNPGTQFSPSFTWKIVESIGDNRKVNKDNRFQLPFPPNLKVRICQSSDGPLTTHTKDKIDAIDFCASEKIPIVAAKDGTVFEVIQNYTEGGRDPNLLGKENKIRILHEDGLISEYAHLYPNSADVKIGDKVKKGQQIALLGNVGYS